MSRVRVPNRRRTGWEEGPGVLTSQAFTTSTSAILGSGQANLDDGVTVVRLRGFVELTLSAGGALDGFAGAIGIGIVSTPAFDIGITAVPTPITEIEWEGWMWHQLFSLHSPGAFSATSTGSVLRLPIDSKAMRKFDSQETILAVMEVTETGTTAMTVRLGTRLLLKLA